MPDSVSFVERTATLGPLIAAHPLVRVLNFHNTTRPRALEYDRQLAQLSHLFSSVDEHDLDQYLTTGCWHKSKPGLIVALYNGYRNNYDIFLPLLERYGFVGWFFIVTAFVCAPAAEQPAFISQHTIRTVPDEYPDGRYALSWREIKNLDRNHVIASHTRTHSHLAALHPEAMVGEIIGAQEDLEARLGHSVRSFASLSGIAYGEHAQADRLIEAAGYQFVFSNFRIQRLRDEFSRSNSEYGEYQR